MELGKVKYGVDKKLEDDANKLLRQNVKENKRSVSRDVEKMKFEAGLISSEELHHYDPSNDWDTQDEVFVIKVQNLDNIEASLCTDGNIRARSREDPKLPVGVWGRAGEEERRGLARHIQDDDDWGATTEYIPLLGANDGPRKQCTKCKRPKGLQYFYRDARNTDGLHSWCMECHREHKRVTYEKIQNGRSEA